MAPQIQVIAFDADDTLWHHETLYSVTQERFRELLLPYLPGEEIDARLHATEIRNLKLFGYGVKGFVLSMIETAIEVSEGQVATADIQAILDAGKAMLAHPTELLEGVPEAIESLAERYRLMVITKGDLFDQESKIARSGLAGRFWRIEIVSEKDEAVYRRILATHGIAPVEFLMVGNSLKSDVLPVVRLGGRAVHVPYHTTWVHERLDAAEASPDGYWTLENLRQLPELLERM